MVDSSSKTFLDRDFLSLANHDDDDDHGDNQHCVDSATDQEVTTAAVASVTSGSKKRGRSTSPIPSAQNNALAAASTNHHNGKSKLAQRVHSVPWLAPLPPPLPQQQQQGKETIANNRGYSSNSNNRQRHPSFQTHQQFYNHYSPPLIRLHNEITSFVALMSPTSHEMELRDTMVQRITKLSQNTFGGKDKCQVLPFGSQVTGLCLPGSDIDFVIRFQSSSTAAAAAAGAGVSRRVVDEDENDYTVNPLHRFAEAVQEDFGLQNSDDSSCSDDDEEYLSYLEIIETARVPLVKFTVEPYNLDIDVCFDQPHGPESADLMHRFMESMPPLRPLTVVLKYFLASREINKPFTGGIGSYLLQLMIVSYLQHRAREDVARNCGASGRHYNLGSLLLEFLELYGVDYNYITTGISVRHDGYYFAKGGKDAKNPFWQPTRPFSIAMENPLDPTSDVGAGAFRMQMIQRIFAHAFKTLLAYTSEPYERTDSILARIIPPTDEMERRMVLKRSILLESLEDMDKAGSYRNEHNGNGRSNTDNLKKRPKKGAR